MQQGLQPAALALFFVAAGEGRFRPAESPNGARPEPACPRAERSSFCALQRARRSFAEFESRPQTMSRTFASGVVPPSTTLIRARDICGRSTSELPTATLVLRETTPVLGIRSPPIWVQVWPSPVDSKLTVTVTALPATLSTSA